jgi:hypothetical protein
LHESTGVVRAWHVLAGEMDAHGRMHAIRVDFAALAATQRPVILVIRIEGAVLPANAVASIQTLVHDWQRVLPVAGIEVDFDSGARRLGDYGVFLRTLHAAVGAQLPLSITLLPDWLDMPEFRQLLASVDHVILQLHGLPRTGAPLFDPSTAILWTRRMAHYAKPFRIALPNYGSRVTLDASGKVVAVESEMPIDPRDGDTQEVFAAPNQVAGFLAKLAMSPTPSLIGVVWFRLPLDGDVRTWTRRTWHSVIRREPLGTILSAQWRANRDPRTKSQLLLTNVGVIDAEFPESLDINLTCKNGSEQPFLLEPTVANGSSVFLRSRKGLLRAGNSIIAATADCTGNTQVATIRIHK